MMAHPERTTEGIGGRLEHVFVRGSLVLAAALLLSALGGWSQVRARAVADSAAAALEATAAHTAGEFDVKLGSGGIASRALLLQLERAGIVQGYARRFDIDPELAGAIYDIARQEGIAASTAFRLVQVESNFKARARSTADALGYTQVQLPTARYYDRSITEQKLMQRDVNLRIGFRYLKDLLQQFSGDMHLALLAYNRGPARVEQILAEGGDPGNGYSSAVLRSQRAPVAAPVRGVMQ
jgi:soluble lytic murein transglycosylase-like protein